MLIGGKSMKVLVTGVNGQLGYDVMNELNQRGHEAIGSDITESNEHFQKYVQLDITNKEAVESEITKINPDVVVHCAAWTAVDLAEDDDTLSVDIEVFVQDVLSGIASIKAENLTFS